MFQRSHFNIVLSTDRSSRPEVFCKKGVLKNFAKFTGKRLRPAILLKNRFSTDVFL